MLEQELNTINLLFYMNSNSYKTIEPKTKELIKVFKKKSLKNFTQKDIEKYFIYLKQHDNKNSTINSKLAYLSKALKYYGNTSLIMPYQTIKHKQKDIINSDIFYSLIQTIQDKELIQFITIAFYTGLRASEILSLNKQLIKKIDNIYFLSIYDTKNKHNNYIPVNQTLNSTLDNFKDWTYNYKQVYYLLKKYSINPHLFRHSFITRCFQSGLDSFTVMKLVNQTSLQSTKQYVHLQNNFLKDIVQNIQ